MAFMKRGRSLAVTAWLLTFLVSLVVVSIFMVTRSVEEPAKNKNKKAFSNEPSPTPARSARGGSAMAVMAWGFAAVASLVVVSVLVVTSSIAAFTDTTDNTGNTFSTGTVDLVDDDLAAVMFTVTDMVPGQSVTDCILVTYQGSVANPAGVRIYSGGYTDSGDLDTYLNVTIEEGTGGTFGDCTGFALENTIESGGTLSDFDTAHTNYATGAGVWDPASTPESKTYQITVELDAAAPDAEQGESVTAMTLTWEVQS